MTLWTSDPSFGGRRKACRSNELDTLSGSSPDDLSCEILAGLSCEYLRVRLVLLLRLAPRRLLDSDGEAQTQTGGGSRPVGSPGG